MNCKCKECKALFYTEAPSRIKNPLCSTCILKERTKPVANLPRDFEQVIAKLKSEFGVCPKAGCSNPLIPLQSFKHNGIMYCHNCYRSFTYSIN